MDYVLFGMGYGATLMLLGWALRTFGPERKYKSVDPNDGDRRAEQLSWIRFVQGLGGMVAIAGSALVLLTFIIMLVNPSDNTGGVIALISWIFVVASILAWCWVYIARFGITGLWSRTEGYGLRSGPVQNSTSRPLSSSAMRLEPSVHSEKNLEPSPRAEEIFPELEIPVDHPSDHETIDVPINLDDQESQPAEAGHDDPEYDFGDSTDTTVPAEIGGRAEAIRRLRERQSRS